MVIRAARAESPVEGAPSRSPCRIPHRGCTESVQIIDTGEIFAILGAIVFPDALICHPRARLAVEIARRLSLVRRYSWRIMANGCLQRL